MIPIHPLSICNQSNCGQKPGEHIQIGYADTGHRRKTGHWTVPKYDCYKERDVITDNSHQITPEVTTVSWWKGLIVWLDYSIFLLCLEVMRKLLLVSCCVTLGWAGVRRHRRSIDPPQYVKGGRNARSYEFEEETMSGREEEYVRATRQAANTNYGAPGGGGAQPAYQGGG